MKRVSAGDGGPRGRRCCFRPSSPAAAAASALDRPGATARFRGVAPRPHEPIRRPQHAGRRSPRPPRAPDSSSSSSPITATRRARRIRRCIGRACCASTASRSARRGGHYVALGMPQAPYPLGGEAARRRRRRAAARRLRHRRASRFAEARAALARLDAPIDGLEMVNPDTSWRVHLLERPASRLGLLRALLALSGAAAPKRLPHC